jgi:hypothetical protein
MAGIRDILNGTRVEAVKGVSWPDYRELVGMNPSTLVHGRKSMLALKHAWDHPRKDTPDFRFGRAVHTILLEPREFANRYTYWEGARRGNDYKAFAADAFLHGQEVLAEDEWYACQDMALRFVGDENVQTLIAMGAAEVTVFGVEETLQCRGRIDWVSVSGDALMDLKTCRDLRRRSRDFFAYDYDIKLGLYQRWLERATQVPRPVCVVWVEKAPPYDVVVEMVPQPVLDQGVDKALRILRALRVAIETDTWPGIARGEVLTLEVPNWAMEDDLDGALEVEHGD